MTPAARETQTAMIAPQIAMPGYLAPNAVTAPAALKAPITASPAEPSSLEARRRRQNRWTHRS
ncbi:MAG: hypothetical protein AAFQ85_06540 [Pseudomonadota bacterium]